MKRDPMDPSDLTAEKFHSHATQRPSTRKIVQPKTVTDRGRDPSPTGAHRDPYLPKASEISGYDPKLRPAIAAAEALERRNAAAKRRRKR